MVEPTKELALTSPQPLTPGYAVTFVSALVVLGVISTAWLVFLVIAATLFAVEGTGLPLLVVGGSGALLYRAWRAMAQTMRHRLHPVAVEDYDALPPSFGMLSHGLQTLVTSTRTTRAAIAEPELPEAEVSRAVFEWLMMVERLQGDDVRDLRDRGFTIEGLHAELKGITRSKTPARDADVLLSRFETSLLHQGVDPFR